MVAHVKAGDTFALLSNKGRRRTGLVVDVIGRDHICVAIFNTLDSSLIENGTLSPDIVAWTNPFFLQEEPPADVTKWNLNGYFEYESPGSSRGRPHAERIKDNDPDAIVYVLTEESGYAFPRLFH